MKRTYAVLMCLFWSIMMYAQTGDELNPQKVTSKTNCSDGIMQVDTIVWNGDSQKLSDIIERERAYFAPYSFSTQIMTIDDYECYHIAVLRFTDSDAKSGGPLIFDISADLTHPLKPIYLVFAFHPTTAISVHRVDNYTFQVEIDHNKSSDKAGGGVITSVGIIGRAKSLSVDTCLYVNFEYSGNQSCYESMCTDEVPANSGSHSYSNTCIDELDTDDIPSVNIYPNPVKDYFFVEANELDIQRIDILSLQGNPMNHLVTIDYMDGRLMIDTTRLNSGLYILQLETSSGRVSEKISVQQ